MVMKAGFWCLTMATLTRNLKKMTKTSSVARLHIMCFSTFPLLLLHFFLSRPHPDVTIMVDWVWNTKLVGYFCSSWLVSLSAPWCMLSGRVVVPGLVFTTVVCRHLATTSSREILLNAYWGCVWVCTFHLGKSHGGWWGETQRETFIWHFEFWWCKFLGTTVYGVNV